MNYFWMSYFQLVVSIHLYIPRFFSFHQAKSGSQVSCHNVRGGLQVASLLPGYHRETIIHTDIHSTVNLELPADLTPCTSLYCGRKQKYPGRTESSEDLPRTFFLWGDSANIRSHEAALVCRAVTEICHVFVICMNARYEKNGNTQMDLFRMELQSINQSAAQILYSRRE